MSIPVRPFLFRAALAAVALAGCARAADDSASIEERLRKLEATVETLQQENGALRRELGHASAAGEPGNRGDKPILLPAGNEMRLTVGGFMQVQGEFGDAGDDRFAGARDRFYFRRARMYLAGAFAEHFDFKIEGEFGANSITPSTGLRAQGNEIYVGWTRYPEAIIRVGQLKPAFGGEQLQAETRSPTVERYLGNDRLTDPRQLGLGVGGDLFDRRWSYLIVVGNGNGSNTSANDNSKFMWTARIATVAFDRASMGRLVIGVDGMYSVDDAVSRPGFGFDSIPGGLMDNIFAGRRVGSSVDAMWHIGQLDLTAEVLQVRFTPRNQLPSPVFTARGWELMATYNVVPHLLQTVIRRESFAPNNQLGGDRTDNWVVGANYLIKGEDLRLMVDYLFGRAADLPNDRGRLLTRFQVIF